jgi:hypothetical protein
MIDSILVINGWDRFPMAILKNAIFLDQCSYFIQIGETFMHINEGFPVIFHAEQLHVRMLEQSG